MGETDVILKEAREDFGRRDWPRALEGFRAVRSQEELAAEDLSALGDSAWWCGEVPEALSA
ncbi:MAG TPA: helix-turn-helix transcriptional regulator, partial [Actinomycetota bacterium]|nr:helix-turn-helix transcriptional regulator [Actinomycetota bacterium]